MPYLPRIINVNGLRLILEKQMSHYTLNKNIL